MSYNYLLQLYQDLDARLREIDHGMANLDSGQPEASCYEQGRHACLEEFKQFLRTTYHHRLPRRLRDQT